MWHWITIAFGIFVGGAAVIAGLAGALAACAAILAAPGVVVALAMGRAWNDGALWSLPLIIPIGIVAWIMDRKHAPLRRARELLHVDLCGACGYLLKGLEKAEDGCVTCPECGAAWQRLGYGGRCASCGDSMDGVGVSENGTVTCEGCEMVYDLVARTSDKEKA